MNANPVRRLRDLGQSVWLDFLSRAMLRSGRLVRLIEEDGLAGVTSNPAIFHEAMNEGDAYDEAIAGLIEAGHSAAEIYERLTVEDIQAATDEFRPLFEATGGWHGLVSLEVSPHLARDTGGTIEEARRLWRAVGRPNVMIKIPGTIEGLAAIRQCLIEGIHVNITLLFSLPRYRLVAEAYLEALEERLGRGDQIDGLRSVASFFLSRIDVLVDEMLHSRSETAGGPAAADLRGQAAVASARIAYQIYREILAGARWQRLAGAGARPQRLLWASTGTKNPDYSDVKYIEPLIGPDTVTTMPVKTVAAYRDHGDPAPRLEDDLEQAGALLARLEAAGISLAEVTDRLEEEGIAKFVKPYDAVLADLHAGPGRPLPA